MLIKSPACFACRVFYCLFFILSASQISLADNISPFASRDQNPFTLIFGLPSPAAAKLLADKHSRFSSVVNLSNTINLQQNNTEQLFVDVESYQLNLTHEQAINNEWMFALELSFLSIGRGFMDDWIDQYHQFVGLPEGIRPSLPTDQFNISYSRDNNNLLNIQQGTSSIGDTTLKLAHQLRTNHDSNLSIWGSIKLPTGNSQKLSGSGAFDIAFWMAYDQTLTQSSGWFINIGNVFLGTGDVLSTQQKRSALFASSGFQFHPWQAILLKAQLDMHQALYDSDLDFLGDVIQLTFGGSILINKNSRLDIAVAEDIQVAASPDVNFNINYTVQY